MTNLKHKQVCTFIFNCAEKIKMVADAKGHQKRQNDPLLGDDQTLLSCWGEAQTTLVMMLRFQVGKRFNSLTYETA